jgi:hypothetical protein
MNLSFQRQQEAQNRRIKVQAGQHKKGNPVSKITKVNKV